MIIVVYEYVLKTFFDMYIFFLWFHMYVVHVLMNAIFQHIIFAQHFLNVGHLAIHLGQYLGKLKKILWMLTYLSMWWEDQLYPILYCKLNLLPTFVAIQTDTTPSQYKIITSTPFEGIKTLQDHMNKYIKNLPQIWYPKWHFVIKDIFHKHNFLEMSIIFQHHINFQIKSSIFVTCYRNNPLKCQRVLVDHCCIFSLLLIWIQQLGVNV